MRNINYFKIWGVITINILFLSLFGCADNISSSLFQDDSSYFGTDVTQNEFSFKADILILKSKGDPTEKLLSTEVKETMKYALGYMHKEGSIYGGFKTKIINIQSQSPEYYKVTYSYSGRILLAKPVKEYSLLIPLLPRRLLEISKMKCHDLKEEVDEGNYWYAWNPYLKDCPFIANVHYTKIKIKFSPIKQETASYPEYKRLIVDGQLKATIFFGANHQNKNWNPLDAKQKDPGAISYQTNRKYLLNLGFTVRHVSKEELSKAYKLKSKFLPFTEELTKITPKGILRFRLHFLSTMLFETEALAFHHLFKAALKNESIIMYDGHSGIGRNLNLKNIELQTGQKILMNPNYQIIYLGSCMPYSYYVDMFFQKKSSENDPNGTKNLDIMAYGKEALFGSPEDIRLIAAIYNYMVVNRNTSYQQILTDKPNYFFGVLGDEDNNLSK